MRKQSPYSPSAFFKDSLDFLKGTPTWQIWVFMPLAYTRFVWYVWRHRKSADQSGRGF